MTWWKYRVIWKVGMLPSSPWVVDWLVGELGCYTEHWKKRYGEEEVGVATHN